MNGARRPPPARHHSLPPLMRAQDMGERGTIKFFDAKRGFGFIAREGQPDAFLHSSVVAKYGLTDQQLETGVPVRFTAKPGRRNPEVEAIAIAS